MLTIFVPEKLYPTSETSYFVKCVVQLFISLIISYPSSLCVVQGALFQKLKFKL